MQRKINKYKTKQLEEHFLQRVWEQYRIEVSDLQCRDFIRQIKENEARFQKKLSHNLSVYFVKIGYKEIRVLYDKVYETLVTAFPYHDKKKRRVGKRL